MLRSKLVWCISFQQANEAGSSNGMELLGAQRCFENLRNDGIVIKKFVSDRHLGIAKWIRETQKETTHLYDIWHVAKSVCKKVLAASKQNGLEVLGKWIKSIRRHIYWCCTSTKEGFGELVVAKWKSFFYHVADKHEGHPNELSKECAHGELGKRKWIKIGKPN